MCRCLRVAQSTRAFHCFARRSFDGTKGNQPMKTTVRLAIGAFALFSAQRTVAQTSSSAGGQAASSSPAPYSCPDDPERHRFDFWLGAWDVKTEDGNHVGDSIIETASNGCAVLENWTGARGGTGKSLNSYSPRLK